MPHPILALEQASFADHDGRPAFVDTSWCLLPGERWAIVGCNGSGKSLFVSALRGRLRPTRGRVRHFFVEGIPGGEDAAFGVFPRGTLAVVATADLQRVATAQSPYIQARWHGSESDQGTVVRDFLDRQRVLARHPFEVLDDAEPPAEYVARQQAAIDRFGLAPLQHRRLMQLSNGELRKLLLVRALLLRPRLLILDEPFVGLDAAFREELTQILDELHAASVTTLLVTARPEDLPPGVSHVLAIEERRVVYAGPRADAPSFAPALRGNAPAGPPPVVAPRVPTILPELGPEQVLVELRDVTVRYGDVTVLDRVNFTHRGAENWALLGPNGSGKSTLLSLVVADNPQAYANHVALFGRRRGTGESIWEVKSKLGWMSADLHAQYPRSVTCRDVVRSGWFHSLGVHRGLSQEQLRRADELLDQFQLHGVASLPLGRLAQGEQRLALVARALVNQPLLLVLDEPCQGLDADHRQRVLGAIDAIAAAGRSRVLFVTHHPAELPDCITHVLRLKAGRVESAGRR